MESVVVDNRLSVVNSYYGCSSLSFQQISSRILQGCLRSNSSIKKSKGVRINDKKVPLK
jgi:hypothetical protein